MKKKKLTTFEPQNILVPVDFSDASVGALAYAISLAIKCNAHVTLAHVIEPFHADLLMETTTTRRVLRKTADLRLRKLAEDTQRIWPNTSRELLSGHPVESINELAQTSQSDLIVMGTHGRTGLKHAMIGSVAERVVRLAPCPVLVVR